MQRVPTVAWRDGRVELLDQTRLPAEETAVACATVGELVAAIQALVVRGAPALGLAGAYGVALAAAGRDLDADAERLAAARPTAVNLRRGVDRALRAAVASVARGADPVAAAVAEADALAGEDAAASDAMAAFGLDLVPGGARVLTHCNTGSLVSAGGGTAYAVARRAFAAGRLRRLWVDETRPLLQGARLTAWEARRDGLPYAVLPDNAAGSLFARGEVDVVLVGADRVCADGSVANKVGTYPLAVLAHAHGVPFVVVAPTSTVDLATPTGDAVVIEQRDGGEVTTWRGLPVAPEGSDAYNPAFDVTPPPLVTALVTERGVARPVTEETVRGLLAD
ncbi:MAG TPA: S-methyl-5-thioribose-1-phosphate isomerase [Mycobacteriales bacterium]|nr:S-methyl-5-thioribose-1-phosphate isomerase [Mycobacteriales bacterium]